jgi:hypothetical protein
LARTLGDLPQSPARLPSSAAFIKKNQALAAGGADQSHRSARKQVEEFPIRQVPHGRGLTGDQG